MEKEGRFESVASRRYDFEQCKKLYPQYVEILKDECLMDQLKVGNVTLAMIRPMLETCTNLSGPDAEIAKTIESHIDGLETLLKIVVKFNVDTFGEFYDIALKDVLTEQPPIRELIYENRWKEFESIMTNGPTTILLLYTPNGDAINKWRQQIGHWNIEVNRDKSTIRGAYGIDNYNNIIHGSDTTDAVFREVGVICRYLENASSC